MRRVLFSWCNLQKIVSLVCLETMGIFFGYIFRTSVTYYFSFIMIFLQTISSRGQPSRSRKPDSHAISTNNNNTTIHKQTAKRTSSLPGRAPVSPTGGAVLRPSPPPSATRPPSGRPGNRFRTRIKDVSQQGGAS